MQTLQLDAHARAQVSIEVAERLVEEENARLTNDRAPHRDALPLPTTKLAWAALEQTVYLEKVRCPSHPFIDHRSRCAATPQGISQIFINGLMRVKRVVLKHHRHVSVAWHETVHNGSADPDISATQFLKACDEAQ
jgi:hypothetical protein